MKKKLIVLAASASLLLASCTFGGGTSAAVSSLIAQLSSATTTSSVTDTSSADKTSSATTSSATTSSAVTTSEDSAQKAALIKQATTAALQGSMVSVNSEAAALKLSDFSLKAEAALPLLSANPVEVSDVPTSGATGASYTATPMSVGLNLEDFNAGVAVKGLQSKEVAGVSAAATAAGKFGYHYALGTGDDALAHTLASTAIKAGAYLSAGNGYLDLSDEALVSVVNDVADNIPTMIGVVLGMLGFGNTMSDQMVSLAPQLASSSEPTSSSSTQTGVLPGPVKLAFANVLTADSLPLVKADFLSQFTKQVTGLIATIASPETTIDSEVDLSFINIAVKDGVYSVSMNFNKTLLGYLIKNAIVTAMNNSTKTDDASSEEATSSENTLSPEAVSSLVDVILKNFVTLNSCKLAASFSATKGILSFSHDIDFAFNATEQMILVLSKASDEMLSAIGSEILAMPVSFSFASAGMLNLAYNDDVTVTLPANFTDYVFVQKDDTSSSVPVVQ